jgi:hypothetical protein
LPEQLDEDNRSDEAAINFCKKRKLPLTISSVLKARIDAVLEKPLEATDGLFIEKHRNSGYRFLKLAPSNFAVWDSKVIEGDQKKLEQQLFEQVEHVLPGRTTQDILFELMLKSRYELTTPIEQIEVEKQEEITRRAEQRKADQVQLDRLQLSRDTAPDRVIAADSIYGLAESKDTGRVFEFFTKPTIRNIIATAIEGKQGVRTPIGTLEIQNIKKAMQLAGATPAELSAAQMILRNSTMLNLMDTISLMPKQGQITEGERALIANLNPNVWEDTRDSAMAKSQLVKARAEYDQDVSEIYSKWKGKNPAGLMDDFKQSPELKQRYDQYGQVTKQIANKYFPNAKPAPSTRVQPSGGGSLESQIRS